MKRLAALAVASLVVLAGCKEEIAGVTCETEADCPGGKCNDGICVEGPSVADASTPDASTPDGGPQCTKNEDCGTCEKCSSGACVVQADGEDLKDECADGLCATGTCDGAGACGVKPANTPCRAAADVCDVAEVCDGASFECPTNEFAPSTKECRASAGACDIAEKCSGTGAACPTDEFAPPTKECRAAVSG